MATKKTETSAATASEDFDLKSFLGKAKDISTPDIDGWFSAKEAPEGTIIAGQVIGTLTGRDKDDPTKKWIAVTVTLAKACPAVKLQDGSAKGVLEPGKVIALRLNHNLMNLLDYAEDKCKFVAQYTGKKALKRGEINCYKLAIDASAKKGPRPTFENTQAAEVATSESDDFPF